MKPSRLAQVFCSYAALLSAILVMLAGCSRQPASSESANETAGASDSRFEPLTNMVLIKAGNIVRGKHSITLTRDFWIGKYEVTQAEFSTLLGRNPSFFTNHPAFPVEKVTHEQASAYCRALTARERAAGRLPATYEYRLPSEAEWEYACRAGSTNHFSFGDSEADAHDFAWTAENAEGTPHPVGLKRPNQWGLHDMHGTVWEWCQDWFVEYPATPLQDPLGPPGGKYKVFRGGGWNQDVKFARASNRFMMAPGTGINFVGFRVALSSRAPSR